MNETVKNALRSAISDGNAELFQSLYEDFDGPFSDTKLTDEDKKEIFLLVVLNSPNVDLVQYAVNCGLGEFFKDNEEKNSFLHLAASSDNLETVKYFLTLTDNIDAKNASGYTPLASACMDTNNVEIIKTLIKAGANKECLSSEKENLLILTAGINPNVDIVKYVHNLGFDLESKDANGFTPLLEAALLQTNDDVISYLVNEGANINARTRNGENMFHLCSQNSSFSVARYISSAFNASGTTSEGTTCIDMALMHSKDPNILNLYLEKQKIENLMHACYNSNPYILESMFHAGYPINSRDEDGMTPFMFACRVNTNVDIVKMFLCNKVYAEMKDKKGRTALHYAAVNNNKDIYEFMKNEEQLKDLDIPDNDMNSPEDYLKNPDIFD